ncbi:ATP-binding protein [Candidatus Chlorohelix sp.]|uniref:ATP-binding protein n=1 Tax=Candidatus Chlorohelix sp. TaxID=3139201 RepID=UPI0030647ED1
MQIEELEALIRNGETSAVEFKIAPPRLSELAERLCGFANSKEGGKLIIGVADETWEIVGVKSVAKSIDNLLQAARLCKPPISLQPIHPEVTQIGGKNLIIATVPPNNGTIYQASGVFWLRRGTQTSPMDAEEISRFLYGQGSLKWELQPVPEANLEDLDKDKINLYLQQLSAITRRPARLNNLQELLVKLKCAVINGKPEKPIAHPTNAGLLLFGHSPREYLNQAEIIATNYLDNSGVRRFSDRKTITGTISEQVEQAEGLLRLWTPVSGRIEGFRRLEEPELPIEALREAVVNAVVHRDYSQEGTSVRIFYYLDRVEVHNPGLLPSSISLENLRLGQATSQPRNPIIASILKDMPGGYMERVGSGIRFIIDQMHALGLPDPEFKEQNEFVVTFYRRGKETAKLVDAPVETLFPERRQELAMQHVGEKGFITFKQYRELTGVSESTAIRDLEGLVTRGSLRKVGKGPATRYQL